MKKVLLFILLFVVLFLGASKSLWAQDEAIRTENYTFGINEKLPKMTFEVLIEDGEIKKITIYEESHKKPFQSFTELDPKGECEPLGRFNYSTEDINFDGYNDFKFTCWRGATGNESFRYLIYNKVKKQFYFSRQFADFSGTKADQKRKVITTYRNQGFAGRIYVTNTYKWINAKLRLIEEERQAPTEKDPNKFLKVKKKRIKGKMKIVEQEMLAIDDL